MTASIVYFVLFLLVQLGPALALHNQPNLDAEALGTSMFLWETPFALLLSLWLFRGERQLKARLEALPAAWSFLAPKKECRELTTSPVSLALQVWAVVAFLFFALGISFLLEPFGLADNGMNETFDAMKRNPYCLALLCLVGPLTEELVFRAGISRSLFRSGLPQWAAIAVSSLAFALVHGNLAQGIPAFILGVILSWLYFRTGNLRLCLPAHIANNTVAVVLLYFPETADISSTVQLASGGVMALLGLLAFYFMFFRRR